jgi:hypothetical protein
MKIEIGDNLASLLVLIIIAIIITFVECGAP